MVKMPYVMLMKRACGTVEKVRALGLREKVKACAATSCQSSFKSPRYCIKLSDIGWIMGVICKNCNKMGKCSEFVFIAKPVSIGCHRLGLSVFIY